jgi:hypothetical protein
MNDDAAKMAYVESKALLETVENVGHKVVEESPALTVNAVPDWCI